MNNDYNIIQLKTELDIDKVINFMTENNIDYSLPEQQECFNKQDFEEGRIIILDNNLYEEDGE